MSDSGNTGLRLFRDFLFTVNLFLTALFTLLLILVNDSANKKPDELEPAGSVIVSITWPEGDNDVDLWVDGPGDDQPVGYSRPHGKIWNLLRDDTGNQGDPFPLNYESAFTHGMLAGEYTVNVHCYRCAKAQDVNVEVATRTKSGLMKLGQFKVRINPREELTVVRFTLNADGGLVDGTMNHVQKKLFYSGK